MGVMASGDLHRNRVGILRMRSHLRPQRETRLPEPHAVVRLSATLYRAGGAVIDDMKALAGACDKAGSYYRACALLANSREYRDERQALSDVFREHAAAIREGRVTIAPRDAAKGEG